jgi:hypothetical protein
MGELDRGESQFAQSNKGQHRGTTTTLFFVLEEGPSRNQEILHFSPLHQELEHVTCDNLRTGRPKALIQQFPAGPLLAHPTTVLANCPVTGDAKKESVKQLNVLKRRMNSPKPADIDGAATLQAVLVTGDDTNRWKTDHGATFEGYVVGVLKGGVESVNCHTHDAAYRDTHIELAMSPDETDKSKFVVVEVTPQVREEMTAKGVDWSTATLKSTLLHHKVKITGWLLFDEEHKPNAENTNPNGTNIWRATVWEIHPITNIEILE